MIKAFRASIFLIGLLTLVTPSICSAEDAFFGDRPSYREQLEHQSQMKSLKKSMDTIQAYSWMLEFSEFEKGKCQGVVEIDKKAKQDDAESQWLLSTLYKEGLCVNKDDKEALKWLNKAAALGYDRAYFDLAVFNYYGIAQDSDYSAAYEWFAKAASVDNRSYRYLALMNLSGKGTTIDNKEALKWATLGAESGDTSCQAILANLLTSDEFYNAVEAYKWALLSSKITDNSNDDVSKKILAAAQEVIKILDSKITKEQIQKAQTLAKNWKPLSKDDVESSYALPNIQDDFSDSLSPSAALNEINKMGLGKDRFIFFQAIKEDNLGLFKLYLKAGASIETKGLIDSSTPLFRAANLGSKKIAAYLIQNGANINVAVNKDDDTPILTALSNQHYDIVDDLIKAGADVSHKGILFNAVESDNPVLLDVLYNKGAKSIDAPYVGTPLMNSVAGIVDMSSLDRLCFPKSTEWLLSKGANPNTSLPNHDPALIEAVQAKKNPEACVRLLLDHKADISVRDKYGRSPLFLATLVGNADVVKILLEHGAKPDEEFSLAEKDVPASAEKKTSKEIMMHKGTALMLAASEGHISVVKVLLDHKADPYKKSDDGISAFQIAQNSKNKILLDLMKSSQ